MNNAESMSSLHQGDDRAYEAMAQAVQTRVSELLIPFKAAADADGLLKAMTAESFFQKFLIYADKFTDRCCQDYAKIMRQCALVPEVRGTPTLSLAREIRKDVFEPLDGILASYVQALKQLRIDLGAVSAELRESSVIDASLTGAAVGQLAGGFGSSGKTLGTINALLQAGAEAEKQLALLQQRAELSKQAESMTLPKIVEYLKGVKELPERLLDYGCARCFGGQVSLHRQQSVLEPISAMIAHEMEEAICVILALPDAEKKIEKEAEKRAAILAAEAQKRNAQEMANKWKELLRAVGILLYVGGFIILLAATTGENRALALVWGSLTVIAGWGLRRIKTETTQERKSVTAGSWVFLCSMSALLLLGISMIRITPPLVIASFRGDEETVRSLVNSGVDVNQPASSGLTPLLAALMTLPTETNYSQKVSIAKFLAESGADPNATDNEGHTALWFAVSFQKSPEMVSLLLKKGATNWNAKDAKGKTVLDVAQSERIWTPVPGGAESHAQDPLLDEIYRLLNGAVQSK